MLSTAVIRAFLKFSNHSSIRSAMIFLLWFCAISPTNGMEVSGVSNVALDNPAYQGPSTLTPASLAVDGKEGTHYAVCAHTTEFIDPKWWMVDLQDEHWIHRVSILNRGDEYGDRLQNFTVDIFREDPRTMPGFPNTIGKICARHTAAVGLGAWAVLPCHPEPLIGRFVRVIKWGFEHLALCEVRHRL